MPEQSGGWIVSPVSRGDSPHADVDAIVVGAGHNGLVCANYLARAGLRTLLLEARSSVGGCASTESAFGVRVNICNCDHITFRTTPVMDELRLADFGVSYLEVEPGQLNIPWSGGPAWPVFNSVATTLEGLAMTYPTQVDGYRRYAATAMPAVELIFAAATETPGARSLARQVLARRGRGVSTLLRWSRMSAAQVMRQFFTADEVIAPALATGPAVWGLSPETPGTGLGALTYAIRHVASVGRPVGGSGALTSGLRAAFEAHDGQVRTDALVEAIMCNPRGVRGVRLADGTEITAPRVISACDPHRTFVEWLEHPPTAARPVIERWRATPHAEGFESKIDAAITALPHYRQLDDRLADRLGFDPLHPSAMIVPTVAQMAEGHALMASGKVMDRPILFANLPGVLDPTMTSATHQVFSLEALFTPYGHAGGWPGSPEPHRWLQQYATTVDDGFLSGVAEWRAMTPDRYESEFNLPRGHATSFGGGPLAALRSKQPELTRYETPVPGLFLTGAATFPGAGIWGASGRNCATVVVRRL